MGAVIGQINSLRFKKVNTDLPSFDNVLLADEKFYNDKIFTYCQRWTTSEEQTIQIKSDSDTLPTAVATKADQSTVNIPVALASSYDADSDGTDDLFFFEFDVAFSLFADPAYITVTQGTDVWKSEPFKGDSNLTTEINNGEVLKLEYFNNDNAFQVDFSTGITFTLYVESVLKDLDFGGESSVYDNQDELVKLRESAKRILSFRTLEIPRYLAETIRLASSCDNFNVNEVSPAIVKGVAS